MTAPTPAASGTTKTVTAAGQSLSLPSVSEKGPGDEGIGEHDLGGKFDFKFLPIPTRLQYDSRRPFEFTTILNITFGFGSTFTVMNLYYCQPLLIQFAQSFGVTHQQVSRIPTLVQAGYAVGMLLVSPLGDLIRRRPLVLALVTLSASLTIGLAVTSSLVVFEALTFLVGIVTVTPQVLMPFAADLAPPHKRASAISIVLSGLLFGVLLARVLAGVIANFVTWRVVFYLSIGLQFGVLAMLYLVLPDWPAKNRGRRVSYFGILGSMAKYAVTEPVLIQAALMQFAASACFSNFWVTLTFLLGGPPYNYSTLDIGLFGLVGMFGVAMGPLIGRFIDGLVPWYATLIATFLQLVFQAVQLGAGGVNVSAVIIACFGLDVGRQMQQVSLTTNVYGVSAEARARLNAILILSIFVGQVVGTAVGTKLFIAFGWRAAAGFSLGLFVWQIGILLARGPHCARYTWFGYEGGVEARKSVVDGGKTGRRKDLEEEGEGEMEKGGRGENLKIGRDSVTVEDSDGRSERRLSTMKESEKEKERGDAKIDVEDADLSGGKKVETV